MNRLQLQALAGRAVRRRVARIRPAYSPRQRRRGLMGLGSADTDLQRLSALKNSIQAFQSELLHAVDGMSKSTIKDNAIAYADVMAGMLKHFDLERPDVQLRAGGNEAKKAVKFMNSYDELLAMRKAMWEADLNDPSGAASMYVVQQKHNQNLANAAHAAENVEFWEKVTNIDNPFSPLSIFSTIKRYAIWGLVIGGVVLAAPVMFPAIGKLIGHARTPKPAPAPSAPQAVAANRRRRG